jgi:chaperone modulatory protein CbpM
MTTREPVEGIVLNEESTLTLQEVCKLCGVRESLVIEMVQEGIAEPLDNTSRNFTFSGVAVTRLITACRLQRDLHINLPGAALALDLLDELTALKHLRS